MTCYVYVLASKQTNGCKTYVGWTNDLERRVARHNAGLGAKTTRGHSWILLYAEPHFTKGEAMSREWHLKRDKALRAQLREAVE